MKHINLNPRGKYGSSSEKALERWEREFLENTLTDELDLFLHHIMTYGCLRLGELVQCNREWIETPLDERHRDKLVLKIPAEQVDVFLKVKNPQSKKTWTCKTYKDRTMIIYNKQSVQIIKIFLNKYKYGVSELFTRAGKQSSIERAIQRRVLKWIEPLRDERLRKLKNSGLNLSKEELMRRLDEGRSKLSPHCFRASGENYLIDEMGIKPHLVAQMVGHSELVQRKNYLNTKDLLERTVKPIPIK